MDYWDLLDVRRYINFADFLEKNPTLVSGEPDAPKLWMATTKAHQVYSDVKIGTGRLYYVRQGECRNPGGNPCGV